MYNKGRTLTPAYKSFSVPKGNFYCNWTALVNDLWDYKKSVIEEHENQPQYQILS